MLLLIATTVHARVAAAAPAPDSSGRGFSSFRDGMRTPEHASGFDGRFRFEGGFSHAFGTSNPWKPNGYSVDVGMEFPHLITPVIGIGFEHHPTAQPDQIVPSGFLGTSVVRYTGGGDHRVITGSFGVRLHAPIGPLEAGLEGAVGMAWVSFRWPAAYDNDTGQLLMPDYRNSWNGPMGEWGISLRTRRARGLDYSLGVRQRGFSEVFNFESEQSGSSLQAQLGVIL